MTKKLMLHPSAEEGYDTALFSTVLAKLRELASAELYTLQIGGSRYVHIWSLHEKYGETDHKFYPLEKVIDGGALDQPDAAFILVVKRNEYDGELGDHKHDLRLESWTLDISQLEIVRDQLPVALAAME